MEFDYVVVGAGAAGCVVASRLAADPRRTVLLAEAGGRPRSPLISVPKGFYYTLRGDRYVQRYPVSGETAGEVWLRGRVLGGSAAVNGMMWIRGAPADWDGLAARGNPGWGWSDLSSVYSELETRLGVSTPPPTGIIRAILGSAESYGWSVADDFNARDTERIGLTPSSIASGRRVTSYSALIRPAGRRPNLTVAPGTRAASLLFDGSPAHGSQRNSSQRHGSRARGIRARGIRAADGTEIRARREVIVCAGAIETPLLLERSGIGRPDIVRALGADLAAESPNVGERLIEQRGLGLQVKLKRGQGMTLARQAAAALVYLSTKHGLLSTGGYDLVCQFKSAPGLPRPDIQGLFAPFAVDTASEHLKAARHPGIMFMGYPVRPETASSVHVTGASPGDPPVIDARYLETEADRAAAAPVLDIARGVLGQGPVAELVAEEEFPGPAVATFEQAIEYSRRYGSGIYHAVGSAAMGPDPGDVTDARLRVRGVAGLRIADASVLPRQVSGNTAAPAMAVGWRAADFILEEN